MSTVKSNSHGENRNLVKWAGVVYIMATVAPIWTFPFVGFLGGGSAGEPIPDYLVHIAANENQVIIGVQEMVFAGWLIVKGVNSQAATPGR
jgi:hypothetical protein